MCSCDERAIERILFRYARCVDSANWEGLGELFRYGQVVTEGVEGVAAGPEAVRDVWRTVNRVHPDGTLRTRHLLTNVIVDVSADGHSAKADAYFMVFQATPELALQPIAGGRYEDTFHKIDGVWWFKQKKIHVNLVGDVSNHLILAFDSSGQLSGPPPADLLAVASGQAPADPANSPNSKPAT
jgi:3-phenylpropionate/cinnamic acid dioxygenase small subunit